MTQLPPGFVLDGGRSLPPGFVVDEEALDDSNDGFLSFLNQGIASVLGAPVDIVNAGLRAAGVPVSDTPFLGSDWISGGMGSMGVRVADPGQSPNTLGEFIGQGIGGAAGALLPGAGLVGAASRAGPVVSGAAQRIASPFVSTPGRALAAETAAGGGSGVGLSVAENLAPDNPYAQIAGALIGGGIAGTGPSLAVRGARALPGVQLAEDVIAGQIAPFTERGAMNRARGRIGGLVEDVDVARDNLARGTVGDLSPAVSTGDRRLMALEQAVRDQNAPIDLFMRQAETASSAKLRNAASEVGGDIPVTAARDAMQARVDDLVRRMQRRTAEAVQRAQKRVSRLQPDQRQSQASVIMREELEDALKAARAQEREVWGQVPKNALVPTATAKNAYRSIVADMPRAQRDDIPAKARDFLEDGGNQSFKAQETINEVHGLYSALRESARMARAANEANKARISDLLADALLEDLGSVAGADGPMRRALDFSRQLNQTFRQGNVGRVLGSERTGGQSVAPELTLGTTVGRGGTAGAVAIDELTRATGGRMSPAIPEFVRGQFADAAIRGDSLSVPRADSFLIRNRDILDRTPEVRRQIAEALSDTQAASRTQERMSARQKGVEQSVSARIARSPEGQEIQTILRSEDPVQTARQAVKQAGTASSGLKDALVGDLMNAARTSRFDEAGEAAISGRAMRARMGDPEYRAVMGEILSPDEVARMDRIADEFARLETMQGRLPDVGAIMGDQPNSVIAYLARVIAARSGAAMGAGTSGASLQTAAMASNRMQRILQRLTNDRAEQLIIRAITGDRDLFDALLQPVSQLSRQKENRIIEALSGIAGATVADNDSRKSVVEALGR